MSNLITITYGDFRVELVKAESALNPGTLAAAINNLIGAAFENKFPGEISRGIDEMKFLSQADMLARLEAL